MTDRLLRISRADLKSVRIACRKNECGGVIEVPIERLAQEVQTSPVRVGAKEIICPLCDNVCQTTDAASDPLHLIARGLLGLKDKNLIEVEFLV
jgi:hypothetical protein